MFTDRHMDKLTWADNRRADGVSYPKLSMTHPSRNFFVLSVLCVLMHVCKAKSTGLREFS